MGAIFSVIANLHVVTLGLKAVGRVIKMVSHTNFGLIGLDRIMSWFGIG